MCPVGKVLDADGHCHYATKEWIADHFRISVNVTIDDSMTLPQTVTEENLDVFLSVKKFYVNPTVSKIPMKLVQARVNFEKKIDIGKLNYFVLDFEVPVLKVDPAKLIPKLLEFLQIKWTASHDGRSFTFRQKLMDFDLSLSEYLKRLMSEEGRAIPKFSPNLTHIFQTEHHHSFNPMTISKLFFCHSIELNEDEVEFLYDESVVYIKEWSAYFGDLQFVRSKKEEGTNVVKLCMDDLPFRQVSSSNPVVLGSFRYIAHLLTIVMLPVW